MASDTAVDLATATTLVNALPASSIKDALEDVLAAQADVIAANTAKATALAAQATAEADKAAALAAKATAEADKASALAAKLVAEGAAQVALADGAVSKAEGSLSASDLTAATALVNALPAGAAKTALQARATAVQTAIDAAIAVAAGKGSSLVGIGFKTGSSKLSAANLKKLVNEARAVKADHNMVSITVQGVGANRDLALNRAVAIISALKKAGISARINLSTTTKAASTARVTFNWQD